VGAELFHADGRTDRHDEDKSRFSQFYEGAKTFCINIVIMRERRGDGEDCMGFMILYVPPVSVIPSVRPFVTQYRQLNWSLDFYEILY